MLTNKYEQKKIEILFSSGIGAEKKVFSQWQTFVHDLREMVMTNQCPAAHRWA